MAGSNLLCLMVPLSPCTYVCRYDVVYSMYLGMYALCTRQYVAKEQESRKSVECDNKEKSRNPSRIQHNCAKIKIMVFPLGFANGGKAPLLCCAMALLVLLAVCVHPNHY